MKNRTRSLAPPRVTRPTRRTDVALAAPMAAALVAGCAMTSSLVLADSPVQLESEVGPQTPATLSTGSPADPAIRDLLQLSGAADSLRAVPAGIISGLEAAIKEGQIPEEHAITARQIASQVFNADALQAHLEAAMADALSTGDIGKLLVWQNSPLATRSRQLEQQRQPVAAQEAFTDFLSEFQSDPEHEERFALYKAIEAELDAGAMLAQTMVDMQVALIMGVSLSTSHSTSEQLAAMVDAMRSQQAALESLHRRLFVAQLAYVYAPLDIRDVRSMLVHEQSPEAKRYARAFMKGIRDGLTNSSLRYGDLFGEAVRFAEITDEI